ncbi:MAG TPA: beta-propeller fold lactonase family protein [Chloroflexia bacterium]|nr:beta-propeller fold lactonase family protein [Chloroflexia bacterium]
MVKFTRTRILAALAWLVLFPVASACLPSQPNEETASEAAVRQRPTPDGRVVTADQASNTLTLIDVATNEVYGIIKTGQQPHHVVASPDGKELWVSLYGEHRLQVFDAVTLAELASVDVEASNDDLVFDPSGKMLYVSLGSTDAVAVVDVAARKMVKTVKVGKTPHGVRTSPDGNLLLVTNTADNTVSVLSLQPEAAVKTTIETGPNPFEVYISEDSKTAYVSNFLGDSISVLDLVENRRGAFIRSGKQPAMLILQGGAGAEKLWVANTGAGEVWAIDPATRKLITRVTVGKGAHGVVATPSGKLFVTNSTDHTLSVVDSSTNQVLATLQVGSNPNGLTYVPNAQ